MAKSSTRSRLLIIVSTAALGLAAAPTRAGGILRAWTNTLGGPFDLATNWNPLGAPAALDTALIEAGTLYTITFSQNVASEFMIVDDVDLTFDLFNLVPLEYALNGAEIGANVGPVGRLTLLNGTLSVQRVPPPPPPGPVPPPLQVRIGKDIGAVGELIVTTGAVFTSTETVLIGDAGSGTLRVCGGSVTIAKTNVGDDLGSTGAVTVDGAASSLTTTSGFCIGNNGSGTLTISAGASVVSQAPARIGDNEGSDGTATLDGAGSTWTCSVALTVGNAGAGTLGVTGSGALSTARGKIGNDIGSIGAVTIDGSGSSWTDSVEIVVGNCGTGSLTVANGAMIWGVAGIIGAEPGSDGSATVDGPGSNWTNTTELILGGNTRLPGGAGSLTVSNGGSVSAPDLFVGKAGSGDLSVTGGSCASFGAPLSAPARIGDLPGSDGTVLVDGIGSTATFAKSLFVGNRGAGALTITGAGSVSAPKAFVGDDIGASGAVTVDGPGSTWTLTGNLFLGNFGSGTLDVLNGGAMSTVNGRIGDEVGSVGTVVIDGLGSSWMDSTSLVVANHGSGSMTVSNGASVSTASGFVGDELGANGSATVTGPGSTWTCTVGLAVGNLGQGALTVADGAVVSAPVISVNAQSALGGDGTVVGDVTNSGTVGPGQSVGVLTIQGSYVQTATGVLDIELSAAGGDRLTITGTGGLAGTLRLSAGPGQGPAVGQMFTVLTASSIGASQFAAVEGTCAYDVTYGAGSVTVTVLAPPIPGDVNDDGAVNVLDLIEVLLHFGQACP